MSLILAACIPVAAAVLLIPAEVDSPWEGRFVSLGRTSSQGRTSGAAVRARRDRDLPATTGAAVATAPERTLRAPPANDDAHADAKLEARSNPSRGYFVPEGETDDSQPLAPYRGRQ